MTEETKEKQYWSVDDLESLTDTIQEADITYQDKLIKVAWCELTESEEPKLLSMDESLSEDEKNEQYIELAKERVVKMMTKANEKKATDGALPVEVFGKLPSSVKFSVTNKILGVADPNAL